MRSDMVKLGDARAPHRSLLRATGVGDDDFRKPFIAICNSYTDIIPGHVHLDKVGEFVKQCVREAGGVPFVFNTIGVDDGIAMGHAGMKYSLPSRELIADCVETMVQAHCFDGMICIPNCDKIVPGMLMGAVRCNIPTVFVSGGPMEAGKHRRRQDGRPDRRLRRGRGQAAGQALGRGTARAGKGRLPDVRLLLGHVHGQQHELPVRGPGHGPAQQRHAAGHQRRAQAALPPRGPADRGDGAASSSKLGAGHGLLPREIVTAESIDNSMILDMAMGGSTNTVLHMLAIAHEAGIQYDFERINQLSRRTPNICKVAPSSQYHVEDVHNSGGIHTILGEVDRGRPGLLHLDCPTVTGKTLGENIAEYDIRAATRQPGGAGTGGRHGRRRAHNAKGMNVAARGRHDPRSDGRGTRLRSRTTASARWTTPTARRAG